MNYFKYAINFLVESSKLFHSTSNRIFNLFQSSFVCSSSDVEGQIQKPDDEDNQNALTQVKISPTQETKINSIGLNTESTELSIKCHPRIKRIVSENSFRKYSLCNIILTANKQEAQSDLKNSCHQFYDKVWPRRNSSV